MDETRKIKYNQDHFSNKEIFDAIGLSSIGLFCVAYSLFSRQFAQVHLELPFLDFPIFTGEILLMFCVIFLFVKWFKYGLRIKFSTNKSFAIFVLIYIVFVMAKAFWGYRIFGPLALRNAALFYYPMFALISFEFYSHGFFKKIILNAILIFLVASFVLKPLSCYGYFRFTYMLMAIMLAVRCEKKILRWIALLLLIFFIPYTSFFTGSRANILASFVGIGILSIFLIWVKMSYSRMVKIVLGIALCLLSIFLMKDFTDPGELGTVIDIKKNLAAWHEANDLMNEVKNKSISQDIPVRLYAENIEPDVKRSGETLFNSGIMGIVKKMEHKKEEETIDVSNRTKAESLQLEEGGINEADSFLYSESRNNNLWRLFVWYDMVGEMYKYSRYIGMPFGKPFRSASLERLAWNRVEIEKVGWLEPHNSYIHIIYRAGIMGISSLCFLFFLFIRIFMNFLLKKSLTGIFLISIVSYWLIVANFMVVFELPFFAIPFWSIFGVTLGYYRSSVNVEVAR